MEAVAGGVPGLVGCFCGKGDQVRGLLLEV